MGFKKAKQWNFRCAVLAMVLTQVLIFQMEMSVMANIAAYIINLVSWVIIGIAMELVIYCVYDVDLAEAA